MALLFDMESFIADFSNEMKRDFRFIHSLSLLPKPKVAFHAVDADGIISAVILKSLKEFQDAVFIPLGFQELRHPEFGVLLKALNWLAIVDLPPFNESEVVLYCDHHSSNKSITKRANIVLFDENAPSTASLLSKHFNDCLPANLKLLADLTSITDTASFTLPPPEDFPLNFLEATHQEQAWLLDDICHTPESVEEVLALLHDLSNQKLEIFTNKLYQQRILSLRTLRKRSIKLGDQFEFADVIITIQGKERIMTSALVNTLFEKGVKISCILFPGKQFTGISLRVNSQLPESELERYRVDYIASKYSGGGHPRAAGGRGKSLQSTLKGIVEWIQSRDFSYRQYDLRKPRTC
ncbi:MAG: bifunctional oligoribonuclease/PAP phosphatase NrnA [Promethearchaeota archaeon]